MKDTKEDDVGPTIACPDKEMAMGHLEDCIDSEESEPVRPVCWTCCSEFKVSFAPFHEVGGPSAGLERSKVPCVEREGLKRLSEESKGQSGEDIVSSRGDSSDITCPGVAVEDFCAAGEDVVYPRIPWEKTDALQSIVQLQKFSEILV